MQRPSLQRGESPSRVCRMCRFSANSLKGEGKNEEGLLLVVCSCVCEGMRSVRFIPTGKGSFGLRLNLTL